MVSAPHAMRHAIPSLPPECQSLESLSSHNAFPGNRCVLCVHSSPTAGRRCRPGSGIKDASEEMVRSVYRYSLNERATCLSGDSSLCGLKDVSVEKGMTQEWKEVMEEKEKASLFRSVSPGERGPRDKYRLIIISNLICNRPSIQNTHSLPIDRSIVIPVADDADMSPV